MSYVGDFVLGSTLDTKFTTVNTSGVPTTLAGSPVVSAYPDNSLTELTAGITLTVDFDARTGLHNVRVVATGANGYVTGSNYHLVITTGTVGGSSVVGYVVAEFSLEARLDWTASFANKIADHIWRRNYANIRASANGDALAFRSPLGEVAKMVNKWDIVAGVLTARHEDDATAFGTQNVAVTAGADPITSLDTV